MKRFGRKKGTHGDVQTGLHLQVPREPPLLSIAADAYPQPTSCRRRADARQCALKPHTCPAPTRTPPALPLWLCPGVERQDNFLQTSPGSKVESDWFLVLSHCYQTVLQLLFICLVFA
ncbi:hypothetical protein SETIT_6G176100v2 [Setaria italica]|uniref:Uncharacterized protein n=1 Tax=Setaria italica TaxID=4555 RepID=K3YKB1_SETIT|nr:hypothetical protein SETIT_6G176100v2 [Setaria italica]